MLLLGAMVLSRLLRIGWMWGWAMASVVYPGRIKKNCKKEGPKI